MGSRKSTWTHDATVAEIMTEQIISVGPKDDLSATCDRVLDEKISAVPVLDEDGRAIGIVSKSDLLLASVRGEMTTAEAAMSSPVSTIPRSAPLSIASATMAKHGFHRLVVVDEDGISVGILSSMDILRWLSRQAGVVIAD